MNDKDILLFYNNEVQSLLKSLTGFDMNKIFTKRKLGDKLQAPEYKFMTSEQLQEVNDNISWYFLVTWSKHHLCLGKHCCIYKLTSYKPTRILLWAIAVLSSKRKQVVEDCSNFQYRLTCLHVLYSLKG